MLCISGLNYFNHKKNIISFLSCGFSVTKISRFWDHCISGQIMNVQFFDHVPFFFDIHYVHSDIGISLMFGDPKSWTLFVGAGVRFT